MPARKIARYGWRPQLPDPRDKLYVAPEGLQIPGKLSLRTSPNMPVVYDQGQLGSCVPNSNASLYEFVLNNEGRGFMPSRLYIYAKGRELEGTPLSDDAGMEVRDALKVLAAGVPPETDEPYSDANPGPFQQQPSAKADTDAPKSHSLTYYSMKLGPGAPLRSCIVEGFPFTFGFTVPEQLESDQMASGQTTLLALPDASTQFVGGHAVKAVGFDFTRETFPVDVFEIKNSWGQGWCDQGYFYMDARYFNGSASDIWTIRTTT